MHFGKSNSISDRHNLLDIHGEVSVGILSGFLKGTAAIDFLKDERDTNKEESMSMVYKIKTQKDSITLNQLKDVIDWDLLMNLGETQVHN